MEVLDREVIEQEDTQHGRFLTFNVGEEAFGVPIGYVTEIIGLQPITKIPEAPDYIKGIINLRGKIIPVIDLRLKFKRESIEYTDRTCTVVIETEELVVGLIVDRVSEVVTIDDNSISPPPSIRTGIKNRYLRGIGKVGEEVKLIIDCEKLFDEKEMQAIGGIEEAVK